MEGYDWNVIVDGLNRYLRLRSIPIGMKLFETVEAMEAIPKIRRPKVRHTTDQIVAQARQLGWTVGITMADLIGAQCGAVIGLHPQDDEWLSGRRMAGVWFKSVEDASLHQHAMDCVPHGRYRAMAVSPLTSGRLDPPDICLIYGTPGQMIFFINGLQWTGYRKLSFTSVGESACADSWGKALKTGEPALTIPCYAERRYGGVADDELLMAIPPRFLPKVVEGLAALDRNGLRYPVLPYGDQLCGQGDEDPMRLIGDVFEVFRTAREEKIRYLERVPIFEACSMRQLRAVADISKVVEVPERTVLTRQGEPGDEFFIIIDGAALVTLSLHKRHRLRPGEFFGEMSLLDGEPRSATVKAETDLRVLVINRVHFWQLLREVPELTQKMLVNLSRRIRDLENVSNA
jgi:uncharacterized protein (DUF169 family)